MKLFLFEEIGLRSLREKEKEREKLKERERKKEREREEKERKREKEREREQNVSPSWGYVIKFHLICVGNFFISIET